MNTVFEALATVRGTNEYKKVDIEEIPKLELATLRLEVKK